MPSRGATIDENSIPPWTRGDFRGVLNAEANPPRRLRDRCCCGSIRRRRTRHTNHPRPGIPFSTEEGSLFSRKPTHAAVPASYN
jgi:hypothetical protein